jgi:hypothetical protein
MWFQICRLNSAIALLATFLTICNILARLSSEGNNVNRRSCNRLQILSELSNYEEGNKGKAIPVTGRGAPLRL